MEETFAEIRELLAASNDKITPDGSGWHYSGFYMRDPRQLAETITYITLREQEKPGTLTAVDLGCGNGAFALTAAAAGIDSYAIDINPDLIEEARSLRDEAKTRDLIPEDITCTFAAGNVYTGRFLDQYADTAENTADNVKTPVAPPGKPYEELDISLAEADVVYTYTWGEQLPLIYEFLAEHTQQDTYYVLPNYDDSKERDQAALPLTPVFEGEEDEPVYQRTHTAPYCARTEQPGFNPETVLRGVYTGEKAVT